MAHGIRVRHHHIDLPGREIHYLSPAIGLRSREVVVPHQNGELARV